MQVEYIDARELHELLKAGQPVSIVDVRDEDRTNWIDSSLWYPSLTHSPQGWADLADRIGDSNTVVFHCMFSQVRGPKAAHTYHALRPNARVYVLRGGYVNFEHIVGREHPELLHHRIDHY